MAEPRRILLVEDEPTLQRILGSVLSDAGHEVEAVGTAEAALARLDDAGAPDVNLVLSDKNLPAMSGLELLAALRAREESEAGARGFILVTGYPSRESALTVLAEGGDGYLIKPFRSLVQAVNAIHAVLEAPLDAHRAALARASALVGGLLGGAPLIARPEVALLLEDAATAEHLAAALTARGARRVDVQALSAAGVLVADRTEDLVAFAKDCPAAGRVLVDGGASFSDVLALIQSGGARVLDPALVPAPEGAA